MLYMSYYLVDVCKIKIFLILFLMILNSYYLIIFEYRSILRKNNYHYKLISRIEDCVITYL